MSKKVLIGFIFSVLIIPLFLLVGETKNIVESANPFKDIPANHWAAKEINYLFEKNIISGYSMGDGSREFRPEENLRRSQAAKMIVEALGESPASLNGKTRFSDVPITLSDAGYIERAAQLGMIQGRSDGTFGPNEPLRKAHITQIIAKGFNLESNQAPNHGFVDVNSSFWANDYIASLKLLGIIHGNNENRFLPNANATRAEFSAFLSRTMESQFRLSISDSQFAAVQTTGTVTASSLNVRQQPRGDAARVGTLARNTRVFVYEAGLGIDKKWLKIYFNNNFAYVHGDFLRLSKPIEGSNDSKKPVEEKPKQPEPSSSVTGKVTSSSLNVRTEPNSQSATLGRLNRGDIVEIHGDPIGNWVKIRYNNQWAYTNKNFLNITIKGSDLLKDRIIVIDPGHGGNDPGAVANGIREKDIVLAVGLLVEKKLKDAGARVVMTRSTDTFVSLENRVNIAKNAKAETFVSIHANAATSSSANGTETYWNRTFSHADSKELAESIQKQLIDRLNMTDRGVKEAGFYVIRNTNMPSVLVELGFVTNTSDANRMKQQQFYEDAAEAIYQGLLEYYLF